MKAKKKKPEMIAWMIQNNIDLQDYAIILSEPQCPKLKVSALKPRADTVKAELNHKFKFENR